MGDRIRALAAALIAAAALGCQAEAPPEAEARPAPRPLVEPAPAPATPAALPLARDGSWPASREQLLFCFETADRPATAYRADARPIRPYDLFPGRLEARGLAVRDRWGRLHLAGGSVHAVGAGLFVSRTIKAAGAFSLEATLLPGRVRLPLPAEIVSLGTSGRTRNLALIQDGAELVLLVRLDGPAGRRHETSFLLTRIRDRRPVHLVVTVRPGGLVAYRDGRRVLARDAPDGGLGNWDDAELVLGDCLEETADWPGVLEGVALYGRALPAEEAHLNADACAARRAARPRVEALKVRARLLARTPTPPPEVIAPHRQALATHLYAVERVLQGRCEAAHVVVSHWTLLAGRRLPFARARAGQSIELTLEPLAENQFLGPVPRFDSLADTLGAEVLELPHFFDAGGRSLQWKP